jgi:two-component system phosphate regulon sensor histidine kinase PhoR
MHSGRLGGPAGVASGTTIRVPLWLIKGSVHESPSAGGVWGQVIDAVMRLRKCNRKRMLSVMLTRFRESGAAMPDAVVIINAVGEIEWQNDAAIRLLGVRAQQDIGRRLIHLIRHPAFTAYLVAQGYLEPVEFP